MSVGLAVALPVASRRPAVPAQVLAVARAALVGSGFRARGRKLWMRDGASTRVGISIDAEFVDDGGGLGITVGADAASLLLLELFPETGLLAGLNAATISWSVDQRDFGGPEFYPATADRLAPPVEAALGRMVRENVLPAATGMLTGDNLYAHARRQVFLAGQQDPHQVVRLLVMALERDETDVASTALQRLVDWERTAWASYSSKPWQCPHWLLDDLLVLQAAFPAFDAAGITTGT